MHSDLYMNKETGVLEHTEHHIYCNYQKGLVKDCKWCKIYFKDYPYSNSNEASNLTPKHFPNVKELK